MIEEKLSYLEILKETKLVKSKQSNHADHLSSTQFVRIPIEIKDLQTDEVSEGRTFLFDVRPKSCGIFSQKPFVKGNLLALYIDHPKPLYIKGTVVWCTLAPWNPRIIKELPFPYRLFLSFTFQEKSEEKALAAWIVQNSRVRIPSF